eukprot:9872189-Alexandrium_andersonii.AAC.1
MVLEQAVHCDVRAASVLAEQRRHGLRCNSLLGCRRWGGAARPGLPSCVSNARQHSCAGRA